MPSQTQRPGALEVLFGIQDVHVDSDAKQSVASQSNARRHSGDGVTSLAQTALRLLADKSKKLDGAPRISEHYVNAFCRVLMMGRMREALNFTYSFASRGANYGDIADELFTAAARRLGDKWISDQASMVDVNIGISTLVRVHIALCANLVEPKTTHSGSALFAYLQGQAHTLGLRLAVEYFRQNGWHVRYMPATTPEDLLATVVSETPGIVGMTAAMDSELAPLQNVIDRLNRVPLCPRVIIGGSAPRLASLNVNAVVTRLDMALWASNSLGRSANGT